MGLRYPDDMQTTVSDPFSEWCSCIWCDVVAVPFGVTVPPPTFPSLPGGGILTPRPGHPWHLTWRTDTAFRMVVVPATVSVGGGGTPIGMPFTATFLVPPQPATVKPRTATHASASTAFTASTYTPPRGLFRNTGPADGAQARSSPWRAARLSGRVR